MFGQAAAAGAGPGTQPINLGPALRRTGRHSHLCFPTPLVSTACLHSPAAMQVAQTTRTCAARLLSARSTTASQPGGALEGKGGLATGSRKGEEGLLEELALEAALTGQGLELDETARWGSLSMDQLATLVSAVQHGRRPARRLPAPTPSRSACLPPHMPTFATRPAPSATAAARRPRAA